MRKITIMSENMAAMQETTSKSPACLLGIDIGTSTVKTVIVEEGTLRAIQDQSKPLGNHENIGIPNACERSVSELLSALESCICAFDPEALQRVRSVGVCGQMHGCVLWKSTASFFSCGQLQCPRENCSTNFITWQDARCTAEFLASMPASHQLIPISAGYGCATLAWLQEFQPEITEVFDKGGTIMDLVVCALTGNEGNMVMSAQNATSWGYFDISNMAWETDVLQGTRFPVHLLPTVVQVPCVAGLLKENWHGIPEGTPVGVAMGDLQCSIFAARPVLTDAVLNIGSASQLAVIKPLSNTATHTSSAPLPSVMEVPYFAGSNLLVAAALGGGNVIATFVSVLCEWLVALGMEAEEGQKEEIYKRLIASAEEKMDTSLQVCPTLWGERYMPDARGSVSNIEPDNLTLGDVSSAMFRGIVKNLRSMMPKEVFEQYKVQRILGSGHTLQRNPALRRHTERVLGLPLVIREAIDAPLGAAMAVQSLTQGNCQVYD